MSYFTLIQRPAGGLSIMIHEYTKFILKGFGIQKDIEDQPADVV